jgi:hypothetical protein
VHHRGADYAGDLAVAEAGDGVASRAPNSSS